MVTAVVITIRCCSNLLLLMCQVVAWCLFEIDCRSAKRCRNLGSLNMAVISKRCLFEYLLRLARTAMQGKENVSGSNTESDSFHDILWENATRNISRQAVCVRFFCVAIVHSLTRNSTDSSSITCYLSFRKTAALHGKDS